MVMSQKASLILTMQSKQAALFKRMIWEAMNKDYDKEKSRKRARMAKKATRAKKPEKAVKVSTVMDTKNRLSSKINYDALDKLNEELGYAPAFEQGTKSNCGSPGDMQLSNEKNNFEGSHDDDFEHESNGYSEEAEARQGHDDDTYVANDQYNGCNYDDEYNYDEECDFDEL
ncbi:PREDICTED: LOC109948398 isoform [Prunus dulcis]|uniref:PREDICTED: LOC109948398 isoform n=1 Tax=Prunus dulcis TaxID=3755 RepID=A0A5E4G5J5_PRUDU|nr:uncharacterized protein LOC117625807 [Prunus dulcis]VVA35085.1 PREDICTED: LOC109948398 isoform [Prunus dulcis]